MQISEIEWQHGCCASPQRHAEIQYSGGWMRVKEVDAETYLVTRYTPTKKLDKPQAVVSANELAIMLAG